MDPVEASIVMPSGTVTSRKTWRDPQNEKTQFLNRMRTSYGKGEEVSN
jgi:hypothetical protein